MKNIINKLNLPFDPKSEQYFELIKEWNQKINLVSFKDDEELIIKHFADSIYLMKFIDFPDKAKVIDLGSGGGFPGIPLAILNPEVEFILVDSVSKKMKAMESMIQKLELKNVEVLTGRIEELGQNKDYREQFDFVTARALAPLPTLLEYAVPFLKVHGEMIAYKSVKFEEEINLAKKAMEELSVKLGEIYQYELPNESGERVLLRFIKKAKTDDKYPRRVGMAKKKPLY